MPRSNSLSFMFCTLTIIIIIIIIIIIYDFSYTPLVGLRLVWMHVWWRRQNQNISTVHPGHRNFCPLVEPPPLVPLETI